MSTVRDEELPLVVQISSPTNETASETASNVSCSSTSSTTATNTTSPVSTSGGKATLYQTSVNIAKSSMGSGTLALPYAASQGGLIFNVIGLFLVSLWNVYSVDRLMKCIEMLPKEGLQNLEMMEGNKTIKEEHRRTRNEKRRLFQSMPSDRECLEHVGVDKRTVEDSVPEGTCTFGKVAWYALGDYGLHIFDSVMILLFLGIIIAYEDAILSFISRTPFTTNSHILDSIITVLIIAPLTCLPSVSYLAKFSAMGLFAVILTFVVIFHHVLSLHGLSGVIMISWKHLWPKNMVAVSHWFGTAVFSYGIIPIAYNVMESMEKPHMMKAATEKAFVWVVLAYAVISDGLMILYLPEGDEFNGDVLQHLPQGKWVPMMVRLAMTFVIMMTAPLIVIPCGEMIEEKLKSKGGESEWIENETIKRVVVRTGVCVFSTIISILVPDFVTVLSFIGCCTVALVSFVFPPLFYILISRSYEIHIREEQERTNEFKQHYQSLSDVDGSIRFRKTNIWFSHTYQWKRLVPDIAMLILGVVATYVTSAVSFKNIISS